MAACFHLIATFPCISCQLTTCPFSHYPCSFHSSWNSEFSQIYPQFTLQAINKLEVTYCKEIKWNLYISSSAYAKYYFALRSLTEKSDFRRCSFLISTFWHVSNYRDGRVTYHDASSTYF